MPGVTHRPASRTDIPSREAVGRGIIDPVKVVRIALENAASVAGVLLLSEATLTEIEEKEELPQPVGVE